jgi:hypothetical protein
VPLYLGTTTGVHYIIYDLSEINKRFLPGFALFYAEKEQKNTKKHICLKKQVCFNRLQKKNDWNVSRVLYQTTIYLVLALPQGSRHHRDARDSA